MPRYKKIVFYALAGGLGGAAAWEFVLSLSTMLAEGLYTEIALGAVAGLFIGAFIWSHEAISGRQLGTALKRAAFGGLAGLAGGAAGAALGNTLFTTLGRIAVDAGGFKTSAGIVLAVGMGWAVLGAVVGLSGGLMIRSLERALYGTIGGFIGGLSGGILFYELSATSIWSALAGLTLLGMAIGAFISLVEEAFVSAKVKVIKGRHINREFSLLKELNVIGRDDRSDVCLSGAEGVGMHHALIKRKHGHFSIESNGEGRAVYVNQKMTHDSRLTDGDIIRVGSILLMFNAVKKAALKAAIIMALLIPFAHSAGAGEPVRVQITQFDLSAFPTVKAYVSILDKDNKPVRGLDQRILSLKENTAPLSIKEMGMVGAPGKREPLSIALVIDKSESMTGEKIERAKESLVRFLSLMEKGDQASLVSFNETVMELEPLSADMDKLKKDVEGIKPEGHTALYNAIARGVESLKGAPGRKAVIVLTDGKANRGALDINQAIDQAVKSSVSVSVIGLGEDVRTARLERIALESGGTYFFTPSADTLAAIYDAISLRIRNEYTVTFDTQRRGEYLRTVSLELKGGPRAERTYFQPKSSLFGVGGKPPLWAFAIPLVSVLGLVAGSLRKLERRYEAGHLSIVRGQGTKTDVDITGPVTIGRNGRSTVGLLRDEAVAEHHAEFAREGRQYVVEDKGSAAGTFVNKQRVIGRQVLQDGDIIDVGGATIVFSEETGKACARCGAALRTGAKFCAKCGTKA